jgi:hypothetical protein
MEDKQRRRSYRLSARLAIATCAVVLGLSGIALASFVKFSSSPSPSQTPKPVPSLSLAVVALPVVRRAKAHAVPLPTNRSAVYVPLPASSSPPTISGVAVVGQQLSEGHGTWSGNPTNYGYQWERCDAAGGTCQPIQGAAAQTYLLIAADAGSTIRVQETAGNQSGQSASASGQTTIVQQPPPPPVPKPIDGVRGTATVVAGQVRIRIKGTSKFVTLSATASIPNGSELDTTHGRIVLTVATGKAKHVVRAEVYGGVFEFNQDRGAGGQTHLALTLPLTGCGRTAHPSAGAPARAHSGSTSRRIWVSEKGGSWATSGRYVSTTVEGTRWKTADSCHSSEVEVAVGRVRVRDLIRNTTHTLRAGEHYVALA